jgi:class 3 adenylate cyclase/ketosteroid isomerase-like protein
MKADPETEAEILRIMETSARAIDEGDVEYALSHMAPDADVVVYGTGADEKRIGKEHLHTLAERDLDQAAFASQRVVWHSVSVSRDGSVAWVAADVESSALVEGRYITFDIRFTGVLERREGSWLFVQQHASMPGHAEGRSFPSALDSVVAAVELERPDLSAISGDDGAITLLFTDIENSTPMALRLGDLRWMETLRLHNAIVRKHAQHYGGREIKSQGDGFMLVFPEPAPALRAAIEIQRELDRHNVRLAEEPIRVRMGAHTGGAIAEDDDFFGETVIFASRIAGQARPSEILASAALQAAVKDDALIYLEPRDVQLKGFAASALVYPVDWRM